MSTAIITPGFSPVAEAPFTAVAASAHVSAFDNASNSASNKASNSASNSAARKSRLRLTTRGRRVFTTLAALPLVIAAAAFALNGGMATASSEASNVPIETVTVGAGQSLWELAGEIAPEADPRDVISDLVSFNHLTTTAIVPGQQLDVPSRYSN